MEFDSHTKVEGGSDRQFGFVFVIVFLIIGLWPLLGDNPVRIWSLGIAGALAAISLVVPQILKPANKLWMKFGMLLGAIVAPIVLFLLFVVAITPTSFALKLVGKDPLRLKRKKDAQSYWIDRNSTETATGSMRDQF